MSTVRRRTLAAVVCLSVCLAPELFAQQPAPGTGPGRSEEGVRLLIDHIANTKVDLVQDPDDPGDLAKYLPGYSVPKAGKPEPEIEVMRPQGVRPADYTANNFVGAIRPQQLWVVCHVPGGKRGRVTFRITRVTRLPGIAGNMQVEPTVEAERAADFFLCDQSRREELEEITVDIDHHKHEARALLCCRDYGGECTIEATVRIVDEGEQRPTPLEIPEFDPDAPREDRLPKLWLSAQPSATLTAGADSDSFQTAVFGERLGDGFTAREEYRGFYVRGKHYRLDEKVTDGPGGFKGGPLAKDLFFVDQSGLYMPLLRGAPLRRRFKRNRFLVPFGVAFHLIWRWEMAFRELTRAPTSQVAGVVNFNGANNQCAVLLDDSDLDPDVHGLVSYPFVNLRQPAPNDGFFFGLPVRVDLAEIDVFFRIDIAPDLRTRMPAYMDNTVAHELGHVLGIVSHRTLLLHRAEHDLGPPGGNGRPLASHSPPLPGFNHVGAQVEWWGPAEVHQVGPTQQERGLDASFRFPVETLPPTSTIHVHGQVHQARRHAVRVPPGTRILTWRIEAHTGGLMDAITEIVVVPDELPDLNTVERQTVNLRGTTALPIDETVR